jgi:PKD repeat protein
MKKNNNLLRKSLVIGISLIFVVVNMSTLVKSDDTTNSTTFAHTVLGEQCTATWCVHCPSASYYLNQVYNMGYDFEYVALVQDKNPYANSRIGELGIPGYPTVCFDGDYIEVVGHQYSPDNFINAINTCGARTVADISLNLHAFWMGGGQIIVSVGVTNNGASTYNGHLHVYVTEKISRWNDYEGIPYHFAMINDYALNQAITVSASATQTYLATWNGYTDITMSNIWVVACVFAQSNMFTDETAAENPESPNSNPPSTPSQPAGPSTGIVGIPNTYSTSSTEPNGDLIKYGWDWNGDDTVDDWTDYYPSGQTVSASHAWTSTGTYSVKVKAKDLFNTESGWSSTKSVQITIGEPPNAPSAPTGETNGMHGKSYSYSTSATDPNNGDKLYYFFDWDDGTNSGWVGPFNSGQTATASKKWSEPGTYHVKVKAKDLAGSESSWSPTTTVTMGNTPPNAPVRPSGPMKGIVGKSYTYSTSTSDPDGDSIQYFFDWGDNTNSGWISEKQATHIWTKEGEYTVKVKARDTWAESGWSPGLTVAIESGTLIVSAGGPYDGVKGKNIQFNGQVTGGTEPYTWSWDFGDGTTSTQQNPTHAYANEGEYTVSLTVADTQGAYGGDVTSADIIITHPPNPPQINGTLSGKAGKEYEYTFSAIDPDNDDVFLWVEWGDGSNTSWVGPYNSGQEIKIKHIWSEKNSYNISAKAKDINNFESDWTKLPISMPKYKTINRASITWLHEKFLDIIQIIQQIIKQYSY